MRLDKPTGIWLLALPCLWGIWSSFTLDGQLISFDILIYYSILFFLGAIIMRSAGCVINDYLDRDFDKQVERTKKRPLASGVIKPKNALILFAILSFVGLLILLQLPLLSIIIGSFSFIPIILYPLMKRITYFPQLFLGLIYNLGIIMGSVATLEAFKPNILWLYACGVLITLAYDTIYAFQDIQDDIKIGVKSSAIYWQHNPKLWIGLCYALALISFGLFFQFNIIVIIPLCIIGLLIAVRLKHWNITDIQSSLKLFKQNTYLLLVLWFVFVFVYYGCYLFVKDVNPT